MLARNYQPELTGSVPGALDETARIGDTTATFERDNRTAPPARPLSQTLIVSAGPVLAQQ